jgi:hypothetical protein
MYYAASEPLVIFERQVSICGCITGEKSYFLNPTSQGRIWGLVMRFLADHASPTGNFCSQTYCCAPIFFGCVIFRFAAKKILGATNFLLALDASS